MFYTHAFFATIILSLLQILQKLVDESREKCCEAQRIAVMHTIGLASLTKLKANEVDEEADMKLLQKSESIYQEALDLADSNASPSEIIGEAILKGCVGFRSDHTTSLASPPSLLRMYRVVVLGHVSTLLVHRPKSIV